jgi:hypothetical protein
VTHRGNGARGRWGRLAAAALRAAEQRAAQRRSGEGEHVRRGAARRGDLLASESESLTSELSSCARRPPRSRLLSQREARVRRSSPTGTPSEEDEREGLAERLVAGVARQVELGPPERLRARHRLAVPAVQQREGRLLGRKVATCRLRRFAVHVHMSERLSSNVARPSASALAVRLIATFPPFFHITTKWKPGGLATPSRKVSRSILRRAASGERRRRCVQPGFYASCCRTSPECGT